MKDEIRTPEWYFNAYNFMTQFPKYELSRDSYLEGMFLHYTLYYDGETIGPEIIYASGSKEFHFGSWETIFDLRMRNRSNEG